jgi:hypothetical protein
VSVLLCRHGTTPGIPGSRCQGALAAIALLHFIPGISLLSPCTRDKHSLDPPGRPVPGMTCTCTKAPGCSTPNSTHCAGRSLTLSERCPRGASSWRRQWSITNLLWLPESTP